MENSAQLPRIPCPLTLEDAMEHEMKHGRLFNYPNTDLKKIRRIVSNRLSAQRSRIKMVNYIRDSEKMVKDLEDLISILTQQVESCKEKKKLLQLENDSLRQELEKRSNKSRRLELAIEEERSEIKMLKELEETAHKNKFASDSKGKEIPDLRFEPLKVPEYPSIDFYKICLHKQKKDPSPAPVLKAAPDIAVGQSGVEVKSADEAEKKNRE